MGTAEVDRIKAFFATVHIEATYLEHEAVVTSEEAAKARGFLLKQGIKALLFTDGENHWIIVDVPADKKVDQKAVARELGWPKNKIRMATAEEVLQKTGCEFGAVPPFGHRENLPILIDTGVYDNEESSFNIGLRTHSVKIKTTLLKIVFAHVQAKESSFSK